MEEKIIKKNVQVEEKIYIATDGKEFSDPKKCEVHEMILAGKARVCPRCNGEGNCMRSEHIGYSLPGMRGDAIYEERYGVCPACKGKGYQVHKEIWE